MNSLNYQLIEELYGQPLAIVPQTSTSSIKTWHIVVGAAVLTLAAYGAYSLYKHHIAIPQIKKPEYLPN